MSLFDFFKKKDPVPEMTDLVWMHSNAKSMGCIDLLQKFPDAVVLYWFADTRTAFAPLMQANHPNVKIKNALQVTPYEVEGKTVVFLEHHPLRSKENNLMLNWKASKIYVLSAMDEAFFKQFGGDRTIELMQKMKMREDEVIEHRLISKSIERAQQKLEEKTVFDGASNSAEEWIRKNVKI
ncbi:MAG: hypothetical protein IPL65_18980 [Lewinellaceae bacterium]|nr:hypothetical protein [Lewinellaceae bacterium]